MHTWFKNCWKPNKAAKKGGGARSPGFSIRPQAPSHKATTPAVETIVFVIQRGAQPLQPGLLPHLAIGNSWGFKRKSAGASIAAEECANGQFQKHDSTSCSRCELEMIARGVTCCFEGRMRQPEPGLPRALCATDCVAPSICALIQDRCLQICICIMPTHVSSCLGKGRKVLRYSCSGEWTLSYLKIVQEACLLPTQKERREKTSLPRLAKLLSNTSPTNATHCSNTLRG